MIGEVSVEISRPIDLENPIFKPNSELCQSIE